MTHNGPRMDEHRIARLCQIDFLSDLLKHRQTNRAFHLLDLQRHCRLREVQFLCCPGIAEMPGNRLKYLQLPNGDVHFSPLLLKSPIESGTDFSHLR